MSNFSGSIAFIRFSEKPEVLKRLKLIEAGCQYMSFEFKPLDY